MTMDFAIDPALLEEEGMQDAEGEADDSYMVEAVCPVNIELTLRVSSSGRCNTRTSSDNKSDHHDNELQITQSPLHQSTPTTTHRLNPRNEVQSPRSKMDMVQNHSNIEIHQSRRIMSSPRQTITVPFAMGMIYAIKLGNRTRWFHVPSVDRVDIRHASIWRASWPSGSLHMIGFA
jgi:hypothetical protein